MNPLKIMAEIERLNGPYATECTVPPGEWVALREAVEAQAEDLAQAREQLAEFEPVEGSFIATVKAEALHDALEGMRSAFPVPEQVEGWMQDEINSIEREAKES